MAFFQFLWALLFARAKQNRPKALEQENVQPIFTLAFCQSNDSGRQLRFQGLT